MIEAAVFLYCTIDDNPIEKSEFYRIAQVYSQAFADSLTYELIIPLKEITDEQYLQSPVQLSG
jgi:Tfp pilus assembly protein PilO